MLLAPQSTAESRLSPPWMRDEKRGESKSSYHAQKSSSCGLDRNVKAKVKMAQKETADHLYGVRVVKDLLTRLMKQPITRKGQL